MKKSSIGCLILVLVAILIVGLPFLPAITNYSILDDLTDDFEDEIEDFDDDIEIIEIKSTYGNLMGNGNKISYFGAALIQKDSVADIDALVASLDESFEFVEYSNQNSQKIESKYLEHKSLEFKTNISDGDNYISVIFYNSYHPKSNLLDIAGH